MDLRVNEFGSWQEGARWFRLRRPHHQSSIPHPYLALNVPPLAHGKKKKKRLSYTEPVHFVVHVLFLYYVWVIFVSVYVCINLVPFSVPVSANASFDSLVYKADSRFCISCNIKLNI